MQIEKNMLHICFVERSENFLKGLWSYIKIPSFIHRQDKTSRRNNVIDRIVFNPQFQGISRDYLIIIEKNFWFLLLLFEMTSSDS